MEAARDDCLDADGVAAMGASAASGGVLVVYDAKVIAMPKGQFCKEHAVLSDRVDAANQCYDKGLLSCPLHEILFNEINRRTPFVP